MSKTGKHLGYAIIGLALGTVAPQWGPAAQPMSDVERAQTECRLATGAPPDGNVFDRSERNFLSALKPVDPAHRLLFEEQARRRQAFLDCMKLRGYELR